LILTGFMKIQPGPRRSINHYQLMSISK